MQGRTLDLRRICRNARLWALAVACVLPLIQLSAADSYQFFVSGHPAENKCSTKESSAVALVSGTLSKATDASSLDARFRTARESAGIALRSDKFCYFGIIIR